MPVDVVPDRRSRPAILLRESYREGRKVRERTLANPSGTTCPLAALGHGRDRREGTLQVNHGLVTDLARAALER